MSEAAVLTPDLPDDIGALQAMICEKLVLLRKQEVRIAALEEQLALLRHKHFASSSEKIPVDQFKLFNEAEVASQAPAGENEITVGEHTRKRGGRKPLPDHLPRVRVEHDIAEAEKLCGCGCQKSRIGEETSEQLDIIPAQARVLQHVRFVYACRNCEGTEDSGPAVTTAPLPPQPIPKSNASPGTLAHIATAKFQDGLPLHRQEKIFARLGVELPRGTMANWMIRVGELVVPLINLMNETQLGYDLLQMDETTVQVLKEDGRAATAKSYMWVRRGGPPGQPNILFDYVPSRSGSVPLQLLADFKGTLQTDGYEGYTAIGAQEGIVHAGCLAHARRKFDEALKAQKVNNTGRGGLAAAGLLHIQGIYRVEREARERNLSSADRHVLRQEKARPLWEAMRSWLDQSLGSAPPSTLTGTALGYLNAQWPRLIRVLDDGRIEVDNNLCENAIRPFVMGRKAWLFCDTPAGAEASARLYSIIETAKATGREPYAYLRHIFAELPKATTLAQIEALLPANIDPASFAPAVKY